VRFEVIPAIDLSEGRLARYAPDGPEPVQSFGGDPLDAADAFARAGARWLHVVDMDLAFTGEARNLGVLAAIRARASRHATVQVQAAGGVAGAAEVRRFLDAGADRVVLGSAALADPPAVDALATALGARLVVGLEIQDGRIRPRGRTRADLDLASTLRWLGEGDASSFSVTAVARVGAVEGPDPSAVALVAALGRPVLAAGGVRTIDDLASLHEAGAHGAIVGRAALDASLDLGAAIAWSERLHN
jgi:phosphoribosylformimino-5-aminoimidazole carboxamide ribotide isomerase